MLSTCRGFGGIDGIIEGIKCYIQPDRDCYSQGRVKSIVYSSNDEGFILFSCFNVKALLLYYILIEREVIVIKGML